MILKNLVIATVLGASASAFAAPNVSIGCFGTAGCEKYEMSITNHSNTDVNNIEIYCPRVSDPNGKVQQIDSFDLSAHSTKCVDARQSCYYVDDYKYNITLTAKSNDSSWRKVRTCKGRW